jgi:Acyl-CoA dehydrogenase, N-terminal domain
MLTSHNPACEPESRDNTTGRLSLVVAVGSLTRPGHGLILIGPTTAKVLTPPPVLSHGGGEAGITELAIVCEELAAGGCPLLLIIVSFAIAAHRDARSGTHEQQEQWLPWFADGTLKMSFAITEPAPDR